MLVPKPTDDYDETNRMDYAETAYRSIMNDEYILGALPGLAGYTQNGARGSFVVPRDALGPSLVDFISKVPTDSDRPRYSSPAWS